MSSLLQIYALGSLHELPRVYPALSTPWSRVGILSSPSPGWPPTSITSAETQHLQGLCLSLLIKWNWTIISKFNKAELMGTCAQPYHSFTTRSPRHTGIDFASARISQRHMHLMANFLKITQKYKFSGWAFKCQASAQSAFLWQS